jgi:hypothetical protein
MEVLVSSATPLINDQGIFLPYCSEAQIDTVVALSTAQKNALKCERTRLLSHGKSMMLVALGNVFNVFIFFNVLCCISLLPFLFSFAHGWYISSFLSPWVLVLSLAPMNSIRDAW